MSKYTFVILKSPIYWIFIILVIIIAIIYFFYYSKIIGWFGEYWVKQQLKKLPKEKYIVLNNLMLFNDNETCQIDHIVVSLYGVFVIETKQYNGYITGSKYDFKWVRHTKNKKYYYQNPIRQNYGHVKFLCNLLNIEESNIFNIVCVPSRAILKIKHDGELVRFNNIIDKILSYKEIVIDNSKEVSNFIKRENIKNKSLRKEHINKIKNKIQKQNNLCPKCKGSLVEKNGKYGKFMGCSNYPKCKYTRKVDN